MQLQNENHGDYENHWIVYSITEAGEDWLVANQSKLQLSAGRPREASKATETTDPAREFSQATEITDDDIPF